MTLPSTLRLHWEILLWKVRLNQWQQEVLAVSNSHPEGVQFKKKNSDSLYFKEATWSQSKRMTKCLKIKNFIQRSGTQWLNYKANKMTKEMNNDLKSFQKCKKLNKKIYKMTCSNTLQYLLNYYFKEMCGHWMFLKISFKWSQKTKNDRKSYRNWNVLSLHPPVHIPNQVVSLYWVGHQRMQMG